MTDAGAPPGCTDPPFGRDVEDYVARRLDAGRAEAFEQHYFTCQACYEEVAFLEQLPAALEESRKSSSSARRYWAWFAVAAGVAAMVTVVLLVMPLAGRKPVRGPVLLTLHEATRAAAAIPRAPAGRPLTLSLRIPVADRPGVRYEVRVVDAGGREVVHPVTADPAGPFEVRATVPGGIVEPGQYDVVLVETIPGEPSPTETRFPLEITGDEADR